MDKIYLAQQFNRALQLFAQTVELSDTQTMEIADIYPEWVEDKSYAVDDIVKFGVNQDNETQLYRIEQAHTSQEKWQPDMTPALYKAIGFTASGIPIWTQPLGAHDAYQIGDQVSHKGIDWENAFANNTYEPGVYGWKEI